MRSGCRGAVERQEARRLAGSAVRSRDVRFGQRRAAVGAEEQVAGSDGAAGGIVEDPARTIGAEALRRIRRAADESLHAGLGAVPERGSAGSLLRPALWPKVAPLVLIESAALCIQMQRALRSRRLLSDHNAAADRESRAAGTGFVRILRAVLYGSEAQVIDVPAALRMNMS